MDQNERDENFETATTQSLVSRFEFQDAPQYKGQRRDLKKLAFSAFIGIIVLNVAILDFMFSHFSNSRQLQQELFLHRVKDEMRSEIEDKFEAVLKATKGPSDSLEVAKATTNSNSYSNTNNVESRLNQTIETFFKEEFLQLQTYLTNFVERKIDENLRTRLRSPPIPLSPQDQDSLASLKQEFENQMALTLTSHKVS